MALSSTPGPYYERSVDSRSEKRKKSLRRAAKAVIPAAAAQQRAHGAFNEVREACYISTIPGGDIVPAVPAARPSNAHPERPHALLWPL